MAIEIWTEKYRPRSVADYVWRDNHQKVQVEQWIKDKSIPNILLSGSQGLGKTSLVNVLLEELHVDRGDRLYINASEEVDVEMVRTKILNFASTIPFGEFKVVILEEADGLARSVASMPALKRIMEEYSDGCRFILTTNNPNKIIAPIHSRCQTISMNSLNREDFLLRLLYILKEEGVDVEADEDILNKLDTHTEACYPDLRKAINSVQLNVVDGKLLSPSADVGSKSDWMITAIDLFKRGLISEAREVITENASDGDYPEIYRYLYRNLQLWGESETQREDAILAIRDGICRDAVSGDREICLSGTLVVLKNIRNKK